MRYLCVLQIQQSLWLRMWGNGYGLRKSDPWRPNFPIDKKKKRIDLYYNYTSRISTGWPSRACLHRTLPCHTLLDFSSFLEFWWKALWLHDFKIFYPRKISTMWTKLSISASTLRCRLSSFPNSYGSLSVQLDN